MHSSGPEASPPPMAGARPGQSTRAALKTGTAKETARGSSGAVDVMMMRDIYRESQGNHVYPLIAAHEAQCCDAFFSVDGHLGTVVHYRFCYDEGERAHRLDMLHSFSEALHEYHQSLFARTCADFYATKKVVASSTPDHDMPRELAAALTLLHDTIKTRTPLTPEAKRELFLQCWRVETEGRACVVMWAEARRIECPVLRALVLQPLLHLAYFPPRTRIAYRDFSNASERLAQAARVYDLAIACGWDDVETAVNSYVT